ncbi:MAG: RagB/SusD family nutrient uptake outer membrane protein [Muribaculaceae bacterium]|nr:RagB/SusD family nutrient uptake outer membrane protein [Muribaculaceae bacterium]
MKKSNIFSLLSATALMVGLGACSDNYLDVNPTTLVGQPEAVGSVENAQMALNGICNAMQTQYYSTSYNQYNGETYINTWLNDGMSSDVIVGLSVSSFGADNLLMRTTSNAGYVSVFLPWSYSYNLINQANNIIGGIDGATGDEAKRDFIKASALTFRAHGYVKLLQFYAPRWQDSNNGEAYCMVLRTEPGSENLPLATMKQVLDQVYADLDEAIKLYTTTASSVRRDYKWQPDLSVAYGLYARAALIKNDWAKAQQMAHNAREGYSVMSNDDYLSGFCEDNASFMWTQATEASDIYYWSWGSHFAANGVYVQNWGNGANAISMSLVRELDPNDIRLQCFITPDKIGLMNRLNLNRGKVTEAYFWDPELVDAANTVNIATGYYNALKKTEKSKRWGLYNFALNYIVYYCDNIYKGDPANLENEGFYPYYTLDTDGALIIGKNDAEGNSLKGKLVCTPFGAQLKFMSIPPYGLNAFPFMRAAEMYLAEAEAAYHNNDIATAVSCLNAVNQQRVPGFNASSYSGEQLLNQIRLCRRIELWGEGQGWSDWKRWNLDMVHTPWKENDINSGNWETIMGDTIPATPNSKNSYWRYNVPNSESDYNKMIDRSLLPF